MLIETAIGPKLTSGRIEYKRHPPEQLVLRGLLDDYFGKDFE